MALDTLISGRFSGTYNAVDVGITERGYELQQDSSAALVNQTDAFGDSVIDFVYRGGNAFLQFIGKAYKAGAITPFWPWGTLGKLSTAAAPVGRLASDVAAAMVLTSTANTPAASTPATITANKAILAPNNPATLLYNSELRNVPIRLQLLPYLLSSEYVWWIQT